jgi:hypothetical protein
MDTDKRDAATLKHGLPHARVLVKGNTVEYIDGNDRVIRLWDTDILRFRPDGSIVFDSGGFLTNTTKERLVAFQNKVAIWQERKVWYVCARYDGPVYRFTDGMTYHPKRGIEGAEIVKKSE